MRYFDLKKKIQKLFEEHNIDEFADIDWIAVEILNVSRSSLAFVDDISENQIQEIMQAVCKRIEHIPLAYIFGKTEFFGRTFKVDNNVLIPRMDTEVLIEKVIEKSKEIEYRLSILDIGTGSGAIAITLALETDAKVTAVDISEKALQIAKQNADCLGADVQFVQSDLFDNIQNSKFDFIISNPPYIETGVLDDLQIEVRQNEPVLALDGGVDGLDFYRKIIKNARHYLNPNGRIFFEIGYNQAEEVKNLLQTDFEQIEIIKDFEGNDRVVVARLRSL